MKKAKLLFSSLLLSILCTFNSFADLAVEPIEMDYSKSGIICIIAIILVVLSVIGLIIFIKRKNRRDDSH